MGVVESGLCPERESAREAEAADRSLRQMMKLTSGVVVGATGMIGGGTDETGMGIIRTMTDATATLIQDGIDQ